MTKRLQQENPLPPGYGVWLNDDGTWYVMREYRDHDGRTIRHGPMIRYSTLHSARRGAWRDFRRQGNKPGNVLPIRMPSAPVTLVQHWIQQWEEGVREAEADIAKNGLPF